MKKLTIILSLVLSLTLCFGALAEQTSAADAAEKTETTAQVEIAAAEQELTKAAVDAYKALKKSAKAAKKLDALKEELDAFVADGRLTQEQADLVLKYYTEKLSAHGDKGTQKQQTGEKSGGKGQQKQKNNAQTQNGNGQNGKSGKHTKPTNNGASGNGTSGNGTDAASGATKKGK